MIKNLLRDLSLALPATSVVLNGWKRFLSQLLGRFIEFYSEKSGKEKLIFVLALLQLFFSLGSWINYSINLGVESGQDLISKLGSFFGIEPNRNGLEEVNVRTAANIFFIIPCFLTFFFGGFWRSEWVGKTIVILQGFSGTLLLLGILLPDVFFVSFIRDQDYYYNFNFYAFCSLWAFTTASSLTLWNSKL
ncbi:hypothetical protein EHQ81_12745 [Leptospira selangorensis]|uniref:Uncharacterized protein n=1 Tax=Leptospira selangorensis TaxID=2484982 RepID=A0A4R9GEV0_9LEPT|nr:hypothetical protein [Leptospira selangorensis]TGK09800.1 hypothetical protein EHO58_05360 [Leptospira selangorensis]TGM12751.1 hypothetical protein EHQ81_12745 [Leptospira selangorensis]TGM30812.1 hypothetical protein EHQ82_00585 [Leptospira selangorensis]